MTLMTFRKFAEIGLSKLDQVLSIVQTTMKSLSLSSSIQLVSPINSHIEEFRSRGFSAVFLSGDDIDEKGIERGEYSFIFASLESLTRNEKWRKTLRTNVYQERLFGLPYYRKLTLHEIKVLEINAT